MLMETSRSHQVTLIRRMEDSSDDIPVIEVLYLYSKFKGLNLLSTIGYINILYT